MEVVVVVNAEVTRDTKSGWASVGLYEIIGKRSMDVTIGGEVRCGINGIRNYVFFTTGASVTSTKKKNKDSYTIFGERENAFARG